MKYLWALGALNLPPAQVAETEEEEKPMSTRNDVAGGVLIAVGVVAMVVVGCIALHWLDGWVNSPW